MKKLLIILSASLLAQYIYGQNHVDALKFSQVFPNGTARNISMAGAFGSLGGDFSSLSINPAGAGVYRSSEFVFSGGYNSQVAESKYLNNSIRKPDDIYTINNIGWVGVFNSGNDEGWVSTSLGIGYNRTNDFFYSADIEGIDNTSMADYFLDYAKGVDPENLHPYYERLAFDAWVIDSISPFYPNNDYYSDVPLDGINKRNSTYAKGRNGEILINFAANYSHKFYIGGAITINKLEYDYSNTHHEIDINNYSENFDYFKYYFENKTTGKGISIKLGTIFKPVDFLRIGFAAHLPASYHLKDKFNSNMSSNYTGGTVIYPTNNDGTELGPRIYDYELATPSKIITSLGFQLKKFALFSLDVERVNYENMRFNEGGDGYDYYDENNEIADIYRNTINIRTGAEIRVGVLSFRGGYYYYQSPFESDELNKNASYSAITGGIGYKLENFYIDLGMVNQFHKESYIMYENSYENYINPVISTQNTKFISTIGFRFN